jgi:hypothetical protein
MVRSMPRGKNRKHQPLIQSWSLQPSHHDAVLNLLEEHDLFLNFHENDDDDDDHNCEEEFDTFVMGKFDCLNPACRAPRWSSRKIAIIIRMYYGAEYNARVDHQRCKACKWNTEPTLNDPYAERAAYRLKKWRGVRMKPPQYSGQSKAPHRTKLCEGCRYGHCKGAKD